MTKRKPGRPSKATAAAAELGSWDRGAEKQRVTGPRSKRGRPSKRTIAARAMAEARNKKVSAERKKEIAAAGGKAASHPTKPSTCEFCQAEIPSAREARKHPAQCKALALERIMRRADRR
jgi:hypothetical protein